MTHIPDDITAWAGKTVVVKLGGSTMWKQGDTLLKNQFVEDIAYLAAIGVRVVVVHGGGKQIDELSARLGITSQSVNGFRVTTSEVLEVVRMVLEGKVCPQLVSALNVAGARAIGLSGEDAQLMTVHKRHTLVGGLEVDLGLVGEVESVDALFLHTLIDTGLIPVVSSIGTDEKGIAYNLNADSVAAAIAHALRADRLVLMTDVAGLHPNWPDETTIIEQIELDDLRDLLPTLDGGMVPKVEACAIAVDGEGARSAQIVDGRVPHAVIQALDTTISSGTMVVA